MASLQDKLPLGDRFFSLSTTRLRTSPRTGFVSLPEPPSSVVPSRKETFEKTVWGKARAIMKHKRRGLSISEVIVSRILAHHVVHGVVIPGANHPTSRYFDGSQHPTPGIRWQGKNGDLKVTLAGLALGLT